MNILSPKHACRPRGAAASAHPAAAGSAASPAQPAHSAAGAWGWSHEGAAMARQGSAGTDQGNVISTIDTMCRAHLQKLGRASEARQFWKQLSRSTRRVVTSWCSWDSCAGQGRTHGGPVRRGKPRRPKCCGRCLLATRPRGNLTSADGGGTHLLQRRRLSVWSPGRRPSEEAVQSLHTEAGHELRVGARSCWTCMDQAMVMVKEAMQLLPRSACSARSSSTRCSGICSARST